jgi:hypothetical protein
MPTQLETPKPPAADEIADMADRGEDISRFFTRKGKMMPPILQAAKGSCSLPQDRHNSGDSSSK